MSNKRWTSDEKIELMKLFTDGKSYEEIATTLNRTANAIKLRLEAIVYDNLVKGKPLSILTRTLNADPDTIKQLYYSHKSFKQSRGEKVEDIDFSKEDTPFIKKQNNTNVHPMDQVNRRNMNQMIITKNPRDQDQGPSQGHSQGQDQEKDFDNLNQGIDQDKVSKVRKKLDKLEKENHILDEIIKNYRLKKQLRKLYVDDKLDKNNKLIYERLLKKMD